MKKLFASLLLLALTVGISAPSFAQDTPKKDDTAATSKAKGKKGEAKADAAKTDEKGATKGKAKGKMDKDKDKDKKEAPPKA